MGVRRLAVTEQAPLVRAHLEEAEVLAVLSPRGEMRLAPGDGDRLLAVVAEHRADRSLRLQRRELPCVACVHLRAQRFDCPRQLVHTSFCIGERRRGLGAAFGRAQERAVRLEEADRSAIPAKRLELALELLVEGERLLCRLRLPHGRRRGLHRCRSGLRHENERKQANE